MDPEACASKCEASPFQSINVRRIQSLHFKDRIRHDCNHKLPSQKVKVTIDSLNVLPLATCNDMMAITNSGKT